MGSELIPHILRAALFASLAILAVLVLRRPLLRWVGASLAYQAWLLVPIVVATSVLPGGPAAVLQKVEVLRPVQALAARASTPPSSGQSDTLLLSWAAGSIVTALWFVLGQHAFLRQARIGSAGPASSGVLRPRVVLPHDFAERYSPAEQALVLAHERTHIARGDLHANLVAALFQCVFWFNPLVHVGVRRFRQDQELACDAAVMLSHPGQRRNYAEALLKSHTGTNAATGIHCHWQHPHPTKERLMHLQHTPPGTARRLAGRCTLALLAAFTVSATLVARAEPGAATARYSVALTLAEGTSSTALGIQAGRIETDRKVAMPRVITPAGEKFSVTSGEWKLEMNVHPDKAPDRVWLTGKLFKNEALVSTPTLLTQLGARSSIRIGNDDNTFSIGMIVTQLP